MANVRADQVTGTARDVYPPLFRADALRPRFPAYWVTGFFGGVAESWPSNHPVPDGATITNPLTTHVVTGCSSVRRF